MISSKKLNILVKKWQNLVAMKRKRITFSKRTDTGIDGETCSTSSSTPKGHFVAYSSDQRRFVLPLKFLNHEIVQELFKLTEKEFGLGSDGPITLACDASFMEYAIALIERHVSNDVQEALLMSIANSRCSSNLCFHQQEKNQQHVLLCNLPQQVSFD